MGDDAAADVPHGGVLLAFADAAVGRDDEELTRARQAVRAAIGEAALYDAAAVVGGFDGITRIADATGIPLEPEKASQTADFFAALDIGQFRRAKV